MRSHFRVICHEKKRRQLGLVCVGDRLSILSLLRTALRRRPTKFWLAGRPQVKSKGRAERDLYHRPLRARLQKPKVRPERLLPVDQRTELIFPEEAGERRLAELGSGLGVEPPAHLQRRRPLREGYK